MRCENVVILETNCANADRLASVLKRGASRTFLAGSVNEMRLYAERLDGVIGVVDIALVPLSEIKRLHRELGITIVCMHRLADEEKWAATLDDGALDCCFDDNVRAISSAIDARTMQVAA